MYKRLTPLLFLLFAPLFAVSTQHAAAKSISFLRDAEIENTLRGYSTPLFQAAGLNPRAIRIFLVNDKSLNAFVAGGQNVFVFSGLLMAADDPLEVIGVIAHETGHISGGHIATRGDKLEQTGTGILASYILGIGAALATGEPGLGAAVISGGQDVAVKSLLRYTRSQESAADQAAVKFLEANQQSPRGLMEFMEKLSGQEALLPNSQDPYLRTHPLSRERIAFFRRSLEASPYREKMASPEMIDRHERMVAKLTGYLEPLRRVLQLYPESDQSVPARYARAIAYYRADDIDKAMAILDRLLAEEPNNPFFLELKGQILFTFGRLEEALEPYQEASLILPNEPTIRLALARVQLDLDQPQYNESALKNLEKVLQQEPHNSFAWKLAATAYSRTGNEAMTMLALAESALARGQYRDAVSRAKRARGLFEPNSVSWLRAQDLELEAQRLLDRKNS